MASVEEPSARPDFAGIQALLSRSPGYSVAAKCLEVQREAERRNPKLRVADRVFLHEDSWSWYTGAVGEIEVGRLLARLGPEWFVRHSIPIGSGTTDVDHLLIGPAGVLALNTKHHRNASIWVGDKVLRVNNVNQPHLRASSSEAKQVAGRLARKAGFAVPVHPVLVFLGARSLTDRRDPATRTPTVISAHELINWLDRLPPRLSPSELGLVLLAAEEPDTWHIDPHAADTFRVMQRFERLQAAIGSPTDYRATAHAIPRRPPRGGSRTSQSRPPRRQSTAPPSKSKSTQLARLLFGSLFLIGIGCFAVPISHLLGVILTGIMTVVMHSVAP